MQLHWIWFAQLAGVSVRQKLALLDRFSDPEDIYHAEEETLRQTEGMPPEITGALQDKDLTQARKILSACAKKDIRVLTLQDSGYPVRLRNIADPPLVLYCKGSLPDFESVPVIGVVGTRKASAYGLGIAKRFGAQIAACGGLVVSGGASGIDSMAMQGALDAGCCTVGVLGCGVDVVYPRTNRRLFSQVAERGCLISEYPPGEGPKPWHFPVRNRIISGMSSGVLVVEAPERSGALITARQALDQGRDVFVVPGNIDVASCAGSNALLRDGGLAVSSGWELLKEYEALYPGKLEKREGNVFCTEPPKTYARVAQTPIFLEKDRALGEECDKKSIDNEGLSPYSVISDRLRLSPDESQLLGLLGPEPCHADEIIARSGMPSGKALGILTMLTLKGAAVSHPGNFFALKNNR